MNDPATTPDTPATPPDVITITRSGVDKFLIALGAVVTIVLIVAGGLLMWGSTFTSDYVSDELSAQGITFPPAEALAEEGRDDLAEFGGELVDTGKEAEAYASYIAGHIEHIGGGLSYAELGAPQSEANAAVQDAIASGASADEIAELQAAADEITGTRDTVLKGEILRGTLLNVYAWSTIGQIAGIAAWVAFAAAVVCLILVIAGLVHMRRQPSA
ncbi:MAG: hypothetical protein KDB37_16800 [Ilumatobacter sp.]|nr:hypothetical protein [Ilumatobacter sp.]